MIDERSWKEFRESGMLWFINTILHAFGWAICVDVDDETGEIKSAYLARVKFRGFSESSNTKGYINLSKYMVENAETLLKEAEE